MNPPDRLAAAGRIVRNSGALLTISIFAKGAGLIIAILIARYLGPEALGIYAVLMALSMVLEILSPAGLQDYNVRAVAREPKSMWRAAVDGWNVALVVGTLFAFALITGARLIDVPPEALRSIVFICVSLPISGAAFVTQSVLQGIERVGPVSSATVIGRVLGLILTIVMLEMGAGVEAAFAGRLVFHVVTLLVMARAVIALTRPFAADPAGPVRPRHLVAAIGRSLPFALQRLLHEITVRGTVLLLPVLISIELVGLFDAADRIRQTIATIVPIIAMGVMPAFSREFERDRRHAGQLAGTTMKYMMIAIMPMAALLAAAAPAIIHLLYGDGYERAVAVLQIVIWSQVLVGADMVLKQVMIATNNEKAMLRRSLLAVTIQSVLIIAAVNFADLPGIAMAVVAGAAVLLTLDILFVSRHVVRLPWLRSVAKPLVAAGAAGAAMLALAGQPLFLALAIAGLVYVAALFLLRTFSSGELAVLRGLPAHLLGRTS